MKPILSKINVFNADEDTTLQFGAYADIDLVAFIIFQSKDSTVYKFGTVAPTGTGLARQFVIKGGVLVNQHDPYYIMIRCRLTGTNTFSEYSDKILFYCHEKPYIAFTKFSSLINKTETITTPSYSFDCNYKYKTSEGEVLNRYEYYLYNESKELIKKSQCLYHRDTMKSFYVDGLNNNTTYYVRAKAESVGGYQLDTGYKAFVTKYNEEIDGTNFTATNDYKTGTISLYAEYPASITSNVTHLRFKRRKSGNLDWMTIYEKAVSVSDDLLLVPVWIDGYVSQSGVFTSDKIACSTELIDVNDLKSIDSYTSNYVMRLVAYNASKNFLGCVDVAASPTKSASWTKSSWTPDYKSDIAYFRICAIPNGGVQIRFSNTELELKLHAEKNGYYLMSHVDLYAAGRETKYEYAVSPVSNTVELGYVKTSVISDFDGAIITDGDKSYHILLEPKVESVELNRTASVVETMSNKYPYLYFGNEANYYSGDFSGVGIRFDTEQCDFDVNGGNDFRDELSTWLTNGEAKVLKMFDSREWLIGVNGNVTISCSEHYDKGTLSFNFVEIGSIESEDDMYSNGLSDYLPVGGTT